MTVLIGILVYMAVLAGILMFFRFVRSSDSDMREISLEVAEYHAAPAIPHYHRQSA